MTDKVTSVFINRTPKQKPFPLRQVVIKKRKPVLEGQIPTLWAGFGFGILFAGREAPHESAHSTTVSKHLLCSCHCTSTTSINYYTFHIERLQFPKYNVQIFHFIIQNLCKQVLNKQEQYNFSSPFLNFLYFLFCISFSDNRKNRNRIE